MFRGRFFAVGYVALWSGVHHIIRQKKRGVDPAVIEADGPVQMRTGDTTGHADLADFLTSFHVCPAFDHDAAMLMSPWP